MPEIIKTQPLSLWNLALEFNTIRIYSFMLGSLYILAIPFTGLLILFILASEFMYGLKTKTMKKPFIGILVKYLAAGMFSKKFGLNP